MKRQPTIAELKRKFPAATDSECKRFHDAFPKDAGHRLEAYLAWRVRHRLDQLSPPTTATTNTSVDSRTTTSCDRTDWKEVADFVAASSEFHPSLRQQQPTTAANNNNNTTNHYQNNNSTPIASATAALTEGGKVAPQPMQHSSSSVSNASSVQSVPQLMYAYHSDEGRPVRDAQGYRVIHHLPARMDVSIHSTEVLVDCFALYLDRKLNRHDEERVTLLIDVRPAKGWPNPAALQLVGFIKSVAQTLHELYPGRLHQCILYPIPRAAVFIWRMIKPFLDPQVSKSMVLISGPAGPESPLPRAKLDAYLDSTVMNTLETSRHSATRGHS